MRSPHRHPGNLLASRAPLAVALALMAALLAACGRPAERGPSAVARHARGCASPTAGDTVAHGFWRRLMADTTGALESQRRARRLPDGGAVVQVVADGALCERVRAAAKAAVVDSLGALDSAVIVRVGGQYRVVVPVPARAHWRTHVVLDTLLAYQGTVAM